MARGAVIWLVDGSIVSDDALDFAWLSQSEAARDARFVRRQRQRQFLIGRILLRQALGQLLGAPADSVKLIEQPGYAPRLDRPDSAGVGFSLSHSGPWVACAVSLDTRLGLDIEVINPARDLQALAGQAFDPGQNAWLSARPESGRVRDFYLLWSANEARFKLNQSTMPSHCSELFHPLLSVSLCSAQPLLVQLVQTSLLPEPVPQPR